MARNFKSLRTFLVDASPPCIPYIGLYFTDLIFVEEGNPSILPEAPNLVNWSKAQMTAAIIQSIQRFQAKGYHFSYCPQVYCYISEGIDRVSITDKSAYDLSLIVEPR